MPLQIRNQKKKIKEIEELSTRDPATLNPEQREKIGRRAELEAEIANLEAQFAAL